MKSYEIIINNKSKKYLSRVEPNTRKKIQKAIDGLKEEIGDIKKITDSKYHFRLKNFILELSSIKTTTIQSLK